MPRQNTGPVKLHLRPGNPLRNSQSNSMHYAPVLTDVENVYFIRISFRGPFMRTTHVNKSLPVELGEDIVVKSYKRGSPEAAMPIIDPKPSYLILSYQYTFLRRAMNCGTRITGQLRQPTTSLHTWPITWDIKGCLCLFKHHSPKHTPDW